MVLRNLLILLGLCGTVSASPALYPVVAGDLEARDLTNPLAETSDVETASPAEPAAMDAVESGIQPSAPTASEPGTAEPATGADAVKATLTPEEVIESPELAPAPPAPRVKVVPDVVQVITGEASWYGPGFYGNRTANGEIYRPGTMTAAHRTLPFGTKVRVTNLWNGRSAVIRINDRGPFVGHRVIDLGHGAASSLGLTASGIAQVRLEVLR